MAIDKKLIHFNKWETFISATGVNGNYTTPSTSATSSSPALYGQIKETSIVFIKDVQKIWTHGKLYDCSSPDLSKFLTAEDLSTLNAFMNNSSVSKSGETLTVKINNSTQSLTNTWRSISDKIDGTSSTISASEKAVKAAYDLAASKTSNTGTVTSVTPGTGLTGASSDAAITTSGTINLKTAGTNEIGGIKVASVGTSASGANTTVNANKFAVHIDSDGLGYVAIPAYTNNSGDITGVTAGSGLTGGATSGNATVSHADTSTLEGSYGQASDVTQSAKNTASFVVPQITVDGFGHVTGIANKTITVTDTNTTYSSLKNPNSLTLKYNDTQSFTYDGSAAKTLNIKPGSNVSVSGDSSGNITISATDTKYSAGSGLTLNGTAFDHSNSVEGAAICDGTATSGKTITIPHFTFDDQGHITLAGTRTHTVSGFTNNSGTVTSITPGTGLTGASSDAAITTSGTINLKTASVAGTTGAEIGGIKVAKDNSNYSVATNTSSISANVTSGKYYGVEIDKDDKAFVYVPWTDTNTTSFTITANANDDDVVVLSGTNGTNATTYTASHAKTFGNTTAPYTAKYTSGNTTTSISGYGASATIKIPQITVDEYGHVRAGDDESVTITMPSAQTIPSLSGGSAAESGKYVSGVTVSGHTVTVSKASLPTTLKNPEALTFGSKTYDGSAAKTITAADLGLGQAMRYIGKTSTDLSESTTSNTITIDSKSVTAQQGDVVIDKNNKKEYIWNGSSWEEFGNEGNYKTKQTAVASPGASGSTTSFIDTISQDENGVITATKKSITNNVTYTGTLVDEQVAVFEGTSGQIKASGYTIAKSVPSDAKFTDTDTHYTTGLYIGSSGSKSNAATSNGSTYLKLYDNSTSRASFKISGSGTVSVASDASGNITITGANTNTDYQCTYDGHYSPSGTAQTGTASGNTLSFGGAVVTGLTYDGKGHVTGFATSNLPSNPNTNTAHSHSAGVGLVGSGSAGTSGTYTYKAKLRSETADSADSSATGSSDTNRLYPVKVDKSGYLAVSVPWTDTNTDTNTHWTTRIYAGASGTAANSSATNPYVKITDDNTYRNQIQIKGGGSTTVSSDANGAITITSTDTNTTYSAGTGISLSGTTFSHADTNTNIAADTSYGPTANVTQSAKNTASFTVPQITLDQFGHVKSVTERTITVTDTNTDTDTHYTTGINAGSSGTTSNTAATNPYITVKDNSTYRSQVQLKGSGTVSVASDANGVITITGSAHPTTLPNANAISFKNTSGTTVSYTGASALDLTGGVYYAATAGTASKLSTVSKTAWGQTYWTSGGVPTTISGDMTSVGNITMSGAVKMGSGAASISYDSSEKCIKFSF